MWPNRGFSCRSLKKVCTFALDCGKQSEWISYYFLGENSFKRIFQKHPCQYEHFEAHFFHYLNVAYLFRAFQSLTRVSKKCLFKWNARRSVAKIFHEFKPVWSLKRQCLYWFQFKVNLLAISGYKSYSLWPSIVRSWETNIFLDTVIQTRQLFFIYIQCGL